MNFAKKILFYFFQLVPAKVSAKFYSHSEKRFIQLCDLILSEKRNFIWTRNSYQFDRIIPGFSDIDWTIYIDAEYSEKMANKIRQINQKKRFPSGELNVYFSPDLIKAMQVMNFFEMQRDPKLVELARSLGFKPIDLGSKYEKIVFLVKMFFADYSNLSKNSRFRLKKWKGHFEDLELDFHEMAIAMEDENFSSILECFVRSIGTLMHLSAIEGEKFRKAMLVLSPLMTEYAIRDDSFDYEENPWIFVLAFNKIIHTKIQMPVFSESQRCVAHEVLRWERHASFSQRVFVDFDEHIRRLEVLAKKHFGDKH